METMTEQQREDPLYRYVPAVIAACVAVVAVILTVVRNGATAVLWLAFAALAGSVLLFWEALRHVIDRSLPGDENIEVTEGGHAEAEGRKREALRALKDLAFERSIGRIGEEDYKSLEGRYRAEAREAMREMDEGLDEWITRAEGVLAGVEMGEAGDAGDAGVALGKTEDMNEVIEVKSEKQCVKCDVMNDGDAVFCKKCGERFVSEEVNEVSGSGR